MKTEELKLNGAVRYWDNDKLGIAYQINKIGFNAMMEGRDRTDAEREEIERLLKEADNIQVKIDEAEKNRERYETFKEEVLNIFSDYPIDGMDEDSILNWFDYYFSLGKDSAFKIYECIYEEYESSINC